MSVHFSSGWVLHPNSAIQLYSPNQILLVKYVDHVHRVGIEGRRACALPTAHPYRIALNITIAKWD
jgi:hypothetical protein